MVVAGAVEFGRQQSFRERHADRIGQALAERAGGGFHARRHADLGMARRLRVQLAKAPQLLHRQLVAGQMQQRVQQHRAVAVGQHEAVAVGPVRVGRVVAEVARPQGHRRFPPCPWACPGWPRFAASAPRPSPARGWRWPVRWRVIGRVAVSALRSSVPDLSVAHGASDCAAPLAVHQTARSSA